MLKEYFSIRTALFLTLLLAMACSGSHEIRNTGEVDDGWAGEWEGQMLIENTLQPPKQVKLEVEFTSTHIKAFYTDSLEKVYHQKVDKFRINGDEIRFQVGYDTERGLRAVIDFSGQRSGRYLMVEFSGSEGAKAFQGKWEARQVDRPITPRAGKTAAIPEGAGERWR